MHKIKIALSFIIILLLIIPAFSQGKKIVLKGKVVNTVDGKGVDMATVVVLEAKIKTFTDEAGNYEMDIPTPGKYTIIVNSIGLQTSQTVMDIQSDTYRSFGLSPSTVQGGALTITGERDIQKISRHTMTVKQIKEIPATFGDSISALTALPNVMRAGGGFFGPLIIRGSDPAVNNYLIDDIPLYNPMHFGGIHSVINNDLMHEVDLYASAFPASFNHAQGAIININTIDDVKNFGGSVDLGFISTAVLFKDPITETYYEDNQMKTRNIGYWIVSGRIAYIPYTVRAAYELIGEEIDSLPYYGDFQVKGKYNIDKNNSLAYLMFANADYIDAILPEEAMDEKADPLMLGAQYRDDTKCLGQGITHTYLPSDKFKNTILVYNTMTFVTKKLAIEKSPQPEIAEGVNIISKPFITGIKEKVKHEWIKDHCEFRGGFEYTFFYFRTAGETLIPKTRMDDFDPAKMQFDVVKLGDKVRNHTIGGFVENKFKYNRLEFIPGFRSDYLHRGNSYTLDPRGMISYAFPTETTLAAAGGMYSYFLQTSPFYFNDSPQLSKIDYIDPQKSYHSSGSVEQKYGSWTTKAEGFYNYFYNLVQIEHYTDSNGKARSYKNTAKIKSYGLELMQKLDLEENKPGFYGWVSYTLDQSKFRSGAKNDDPTKWNEWMDSWYEMVHIVKFVGAYTTNGHTFGTRFQFNTSAPYTPTVGGEQDITYVDPKDPNHQRWVPVSGERNSKRMEPDYRLDLRYSYRTNYEWGHTSWYIEVINATNHKSKYYEWDYRYGYSKSGKRKNPKLVTSDSAIAFIPNFGCEVKF